MQDHPGAPGTARQGRTRTIVSTNRGGVATQPRAPGHERPLAAQRAARHGRLSAALRAPGADVPLATTARAPGHHRLSATPIATAPVPAGLSRLRQVILPRIPATPNTLTYPQSHHTTHQVHPAIQVPPRPRSCSTADTGFLLQHPSRAPPEDDTSPPLELAPGEGEGGGQRVAEVQYRPPHGRPPKYPTRMRPYSPSPHGGERAGG